MRHNVVCDFIVQERVSLVCLQETKLSSVCNQLASECLGTSFEYALLPAVNTAGGVLLGWRTDAWSASHVSLQSHSVTAQIASRYDPRMASWITVVYGPLDANAQQAFLNELAALRSSLLGPWLLCGDLLWKERNARTFRNEAKDARELCLEAAMWLRAGYSTLSSLSSFM